LPIQIKNEIICMSYTKSSLINRALDYSTVLDYKKQQVFAFGRKSFFVRRIMNVETKFYKMKLKLLYWLKEVAHDTQTTPMLHT
jgi:hypothetical protein